MEKQQWTAEYQQQSVVTSVERTDESSNNGICDNLLEDAGKGSDPCSTNGICDSNSRIQVVEAAISEKARLTIQNILEQVKTLSKIEKLLLYLKLPTEHSNSIDPLRQPLNPLGSRAEIHRTISWIKTHLEEDPEISLPKQDVYDEYSNYCHENKMKPLSQADFGKVMKQVYPKVRARRLGTRGNSRYCYSGLQRRHKLDTPSLPDLSDKPMSTEPYCTQSDLMGAAWLIIKEWSERQFGAQFPSLHALACYLVLNLSVSAGSAAAAMVTAIPDNQLKDEQSTYGSSKHREMQLQLQKKLQQKSEVNRDHKRKIQQQSPKTEPKSRCKRSKTQLPQTVSQPTSSSTSPITLEHAKNETNTSPSQGTQSVCDKSLDYNLQALPDFSSFQKPATCEGKGSENDGKVPIPRITGKVTSPKIEKVVYVCVAQEKGDKYKNILPKPELCDIVTYNSQLNAPNVQTVETRSQQDTANCNKKQKRKKTSPDNPVPMLVNQEEQHFTRERLASVGSVDKDAMDEYLGSNNSQEHEEELLKYFKNNNLDEHDQENCLKLSQLRQLLEQNGVSEPGIGEEKIEIGTSKRSIIKSDIKDSPQVPSNRQNNVHNVYNSTTRRRVSFETPLQEETVPASPNTRRKHFSFTPISPGPLSPNGRQSKCSSTNASPFVSPRNTPVPRVRNTVHQNSGLAYSTTQLNSTPSSLANIASVRSKINGNKSTARLNQELRLELSGEGKLKQYSKNFTTMSAPPSPMLPSKSSTNLLQKLLNSQNKVPYTPDYSKGQVQPHIPPDPLSSEVTQFFSNSQHNAEMSYRSQSVPLHPNLIASLNQNTYFSQFNFNLVENEPNDFTELENLTENEDINVNKIINALEDPTNESALQSNENDILADNIEIEQSVFDNIDMSLSSLPAEQGFPAGNVNFSNHFKTGRSQSVDVDLSSTSLKFNPSRSVPSTPLPVVPKANLLSDKGVGQSSRSYPSTPLLASETFTYNQDYLLTTQMVKEESVSNLDMQGQLETLDILPSADDVLYNNIEFYAINDVDVNSDVLVECNKQNFNFERQLVVNNVESKGNANQVLNEHCMIVENEQNFDGGMSGS